MCCCCPPSWTKLVQHHWSHQISLWHLEGRVRCLEEMGIYQSEMVGLFWVNESHWGRRERWVLYYLDYSHLPTSPTGPQNCRARGESQTTFRTEVNCGRLKCLSCTWLIEPFYPHWQVDALSDQKGRGCEKICVFCNFAQDHGLIM